MRNTHQNNSVKKTIQQMAVIDQEWRRKLQRARTRGEEGVIRRLQAKIIEIDKRHCRNFHKIIQKHGWPTISLVGKRASHWAWLLVQHFGHERRFQEMCLSLLREAVKRGDGLIKDM